MSSNPESLLQKYKSKGLLVDSNLLLLLIVGQINLNFIKKFKRTNKYSPHDHKLLRGLVIQYNTVLTTPNVLTEVSNLANSLTGDYRDEFSVRFSALIKVLREKYIKSSIISSTEKNLRFGLTDAAIAEVCKGKYLVLTDDLKLCYQLHGLGIDVVNFNHIRDLFL